MPATNPPETTRTEQECRYSSQLRRPAAVSVEYAVVLAAVLGLVFGTVLIFGTRIGWFWGNNQSQITPVLQGQAPSTDG